MFEKKFSVCVCEMMYLYVFLEILERKCMCT